MTQRNEQPEEQAGGVPEELHLRRRGTVDLADLAADLARGARAVGADDRITVFILTYCRKAEFLYGSTLVFKTLRVGFPTAAVVVVDNASILDARGEVEGLALETGCRFVQIEAPPVEHHDFLVEALRAMAGEEAPRGPVVFLDPDVCLWSCCEDFTFDGLAAGQFMPPFRQSAEAKLIMPRLHTAFFWVPDARRLWAEIVAIRAEHFDFDPFRTHSTKVGAEWCRYDTGASLYAALHEKMAHFDERHLRCYDHLAHGCHVDLVYPQLDAEGQEMMLRLHERAKTGSVEDLRGLWDYHKAVWGARPGRPAVVTRR